jgi:hypothetical protein
MSDKLGFGADAAAAGGHPGLLPREEHSSPREIPAAKVTPQGDRDLATGTAAFTSWFGGSAVADHSGKPVAVRRVEPAPAVDADGAPATGFAESSAPAAVDHLHPDAGHGSFYAEAEATPTRAPAWKLIRSARYARAALARRILDGRLTGEQAEGLKRQLAFLDAVARGSIFGDPSRIVAQANAVVAGDQAAAEEAMARLSQSGYSLDSKADTYLNISNPLDLDAPLDEESAARLGTALDDRLKVGALKNGRTPGRWLHEVALPRGLRAGDAVSRLAGMGLEHDGGHFSKEHFRKLFQLSGYDGTTHASDSGRIWAAFHPSQARRVDGSRVRYASKRPKPTGPTFDFMKPNTPEPPKAPEPPKVAPTPAAKPAKPAKTPAPAAPSPAPGAADFMAAIGEAFEARERGTTWTADDASAHPRADSGKFTFRGPTGSSPEPAPAPPPAPAPAPKPDDGRHADPDAVEYWPSTAADILARTPADDPLHHAKAYERDVFKRLADVKAAALGDVSRRGLSPDIAASARDIAVESAESHRPFIFRHLDETTKFTPQEMEAVADREVARLAMGAFKPIYDAGYSAIASVGGPDDWKKFDDLYGKTMRSLVDAKTAASDKVDSTVQRVFSPADLIDNPGVVVEDYAFRSGIDPDDARRPLMLSSQKIEDAVGAVGLRIRDGDHVGAEREAEALKELLRGHFSAGIESATARLKLAQKAYADYRHVDPKLGELLAFYHGSDDASKDAYHYASRIINAVENLRTMDDPSGMALLAYEAAKGLAEPLSDQAALFARQHEGFEEKINDWMVEHAPPPPKDFKVSTALASHVDFMSHHYVMQRKKIEQEISKQVARASRRLRITPTEYVDLSQEALGKVAKTFDVYVNAPDLEVVRRIIEDGRIKNQFETHASTVNYNPVLRRQVEATIMGVPDGARPENRPVYGFTVPAGKSPLLASNTIGYGRIGFKLKPSAYGRATWTAGDSLDHRDIIQATPLLSPHVRSLGGIGILPGVRADLEEAMGWDEAAWSEHLHDLVMEERSYTEAQIHGGLPLDDIEAVTMPRDIRDEDWDGDVDYVEEALGSLGIPVIWLDELGEIQRYGRDGGRVVRYSTLREPRSTDGFYRGGRWWYAEVKGDHARTFSVATGQWSPWMPLGSIMARMYMLKWERSGPPESTAR